MKITPELGAPNRGANYTAHFEITRKINCMQSGATVIIEN